LIERVSLIEGVQGSIAYGVQGLKFLPSLCESNQAIYFQLWTWHFELLYNF